MPKAENEVACSWSGEGDSMIRSLYRKRDGRILTNLGPDDFAAALRDRRGLLWVDFSGEPPGVCESVLRETFGFHPLAIDDVLEEIHVPKVDDWEEYLFLVFHAVTFDMQRDRPLSTSEVDTFLGANYMVTYHAQPVVAVPTNALWV